MVFGVVVVPVMGDGGVGGRFWTRLVRRVGSCRLLTVQVLVPVSEKNVCGCLDGGVVALRVGSLRGEVGEGESGLVDIGADLFDGVLEGDCCAVVGEREEPAGEVVDSTLYVQTE